MTTAPATVEQPADEQPKPASKPAQAKPAAPKAAKPAAPKAAKPAAPKAAAKPTADKPAPAQTPDSPLTPEQKRQLGSAVIAAAAKVLGTAAVKGLPAQTVKAQVAAWLSYLPHDQWPAGLT